MLDKRQLNVAYITMYITNRQKHLMIFVRTIHTGMISMRFYFGEMFGIFNQHGALVFTSLLI